MNLVCIYEENYKNVHKQEKKCNYLQLSIEYYAKVSICKFIHWFIRCSNKLLEIILSFIKRYSNKHIMIYPYNKMLYILFKNNEEYIQGLMWKDPQGKILNKKIYTDIYIKKYIYACTICIYFKYIYRHLIMGKICYHYLCNTKGEINMDICIYHIFIHKYFIHLQMIQIQIFGYRYRYTSGYLYRYSYGLSTDVDIDI